MEEASVSHIKAVACYGHQCKKWRPACRTCSSSCPLSCRSRACDSTFTAWKTAVDVSVEELPKLWMAAKWKISPATRITDSNGNLHSVHSKVTSPATMFTWPTNGGQVANEARWLGFELNTSTVIQPVWSYKLEILQFSLPACACDKGSPWIEVSWSNLPRLRFNTVLMDGPVTCRENCKKLANNTELYRIIYLSISNH